MSSSSWTDLVLLGAVVMVYVPNGFFMNWTGQQAGEGFEYHPLVFGIVIAVLIKGSGHPRPRV